MNNNLNKMDCTFYFIISGENRNLTLKEDILKIRSGSSCRSSLMLKDEWSDTIPEQVKIVLVDRETEDVTLLSQLQRDIFFNMVMESTEDLDTVPLAKYVINETEKSQT